MHELGLLYDREAGGEFVHVYPATVGEVSFEVVSGGAVRRLWGRQRARPAGGAARKRGPSLRLRVPAAKLVLRDRPAAH
jgi:4-hydroxyphenylpyruvate dioxygenase